MLSAAHSHDEALPKIGSAILRFRCGLRVIKVGRVYYWAGRGE